jgi:hypothetical protein
MKRSSWIVWALVIWSGAALQARQESIRGDAAAITAAERLLEQVGGRATWRQSTFSVEERGFLRSGEVAQLRITRDLRRGARVIVNVTPSRHIVEWLSLERGWVMRDGKVTALAAEELAAELQGLKQEPYSIYHRIARNDRGIRVELREQNAMLFVFDHDERLLCWFQLDARGALLGWGNVYDGAINQHYYGPTTDMGDANLPKWGAASNGSFRFEYLSARLNDQPVAEPSRPPH